MEFHNFAVEDMTILDQYSGAISSLCASHKVRRLYAFGSVLTERFNENSDIDLIVDFDDIEAANYADNYYDLKFSLQDMLNRPVDLLEEKALKNPYFKEAISQNRELVYGN
jgi:predicted nucleotidyltransferase